MVLESLIELIKSKKICGSSRLSRAAVIPATTSRSNIRMQNKVKIDRAWMSPTPVTLAGAEAGHGYRSNGRA